MNDLLEENIQRILRHQAYWTTNTNHQHSILNNQSNYYYHLLKQLECSLNSSINSTQPNNIARTTSTSTSTSSPTSLTEMANTSTLAPSTSTSAIALTSTTSNTSTMQTIFNHFNNQFFNVHWCLWMVQQQADQQFQTLLKRYGYNLAAAIEASLKAANNQMATRNGERQSQIPPTTLANQQQIRLNAAPGQILTNQRNLNGQFLSPTVIIDGNHSEQQVSSLNNVPVAMSNGHNQEISSSCSSSSSTCSSGSSISSSSFLMIQCDWPGCNGRFPNEEILKHHRRFHIRKSNYQCKHCSVRLLNRRELIEHELNACKQNNEPEGRKQPTQINKTSKLMDNPNVDDKNGIYKNYINTMATGNTTTTVLLGDGDDRCNNQELLMRKSLIDQLIAPKNSKIKNRDLKKALLAIRCSSTNNNSYQSSIHSINNNNNRTMKSSSPTSSSSCSSTSSTLSSNNNSNNNNSNNVQLKRTRYSGIGRYGCPWPECTYTPHFLRDLRRHMFKHTGDKRYKCPQCRFVSVWKTSLLQHQRKKHMIDK